MPLGGWRSIGAAWLWLGLALAGCGSDDAEAETPARAPVAPVRTEAATTADAPPTRVEGTERLIAIGDVHGDLEALRRALRLGRAIDDHDAWTGGSTVVVQVGDQLDRGDDEERILELLERLHTEAATEGGAVHALLGNHEIMNAQYDFRYVTPGGFRDFADTPYDPDDPFFDRVPAAQRGRVAAFRPGGEWARRLASHNLVMVVGRTAFAHGGILPQHVRYGLDEMNRETRAWLRGDAPPPPFFGSPDSPHWTRDYSSGPDAQDCQRLDAVLQELDVERMVVAHTPHLEGVAAACDDRVYCVDVGLARYYGGPLEVLEITDDGVRVLREGATPTDEGERRSAQ